MGSTGSVTARSASSSGSNVSLLMVSIALPCPANRAGGRVERGQPTRGQLPAPVSPWRYARHRAIARRRGRMVRACPTLSGPARPCASRRDRLLHLQDAESVSLAGPDVAPVPFHDLDRPVGCHSEVAHQPGTDFLGWGRLEELH